VLRQAFRVGQAFALALLWSTPARADVPRPVRLDYERQLAACPDAAAIRAGVRSRLGYDPFSDQANDCMRVTLRESGRVLEARIELADAQGKLRALRRLVSRNRDCAELASSVELAMAIAIDPLVSTAAPPVAKPPASSARAEPAASPSSTSPPLAGRVEAGVIGAAGWLPAANLGVWVGVGLQGEVLSLGIEARADLPAAKSLRAGEAAAWLLVGSLVPCVHARLVSACALATAGALHVAGKGGLVNPRRATLPYLGFGLRLAGALPITEKLSLALHGDVTAPITETKLTVDDDVVWHSPTVAMTLGLGIAFRFP
jgi:hypothetical protein